jgi:hypothetical protein
MRLGSLVCGFLISIIYLMDFLDLQRGLESRQCREVKYYRCTHLFCVFCMSIHWSNPPPPHDNSTFTLYFKYFLGYFVLFT